ncbi:efflux RND transporter periplasmic adaptor subunit [Spirosoma aerophilum]
MKTTTFLLLAVATLGAGCRHEQTHTALDDAPETIPVRVMATQSARVQPVVEATGLLTTENEARYGFKIGGIIDRIWVEEGQTFRKGQRLAALKITEIGAQREQAEIGLDKARRDYQRTANLYRDSVATLEQVQNAQTAFDIAQRSVSVVAFNQQYAYIYATANGVVTKKLANEGEVIGTGTPVLAINETTDNRDWTLKLGLNDRDWASVALGNRATVRIDAFPGRTFAGTVIRKPVVADLSSGTFEVEVRVDLAGVTPSVGMFGKATIQTGRSSQQTVIPYEALIEADGDAAFVYVPVGQNRVRRIPIQIEQFDPERVVVKHGLENIPAFVVSNSAFLNEQSTIRIIR